MIDGHGKYSANETKVLQMILIAKSRLWVDLQSVVVTGIWTNNALNHLIKDSGTFLDFFRSKLLAIPF